jgi:hypothetical protein
MSSKIKKTTTKTSHPEDADDESDLLFEPARHDEPIQFEHEEKLYLEMEQFDNKMNFIQNIIEDIRELADFHFLPLAEHLTSEDVEVFLDQLRNLG